MQGKNVKTTIPQKIFLLATSILILVAVEIGLRIFGIVNRSVQYDPFVGFEKVYPLFGEKRSSNGKAVYATNQNKLSFFNYQEFEKEKPSNTFRIFCFGGSTTYGRPYKAETAFPRWLEINLNLLDPSHKYEVINAGGISYASYRIVNLVEESLAYQPDLFIIYSGHNEFLEARTYEGIRTANPTLTKIRIQLNRVRIYVLLREIIVGLKEQLAKSRQQKYILSNEVSAMLDVSGGLDLYRRDEEQKQAILMHYRYNLESIIEMAQTYGINILLLNLVSNIRDFSPFKSQHADSLRPEDGREWDKLYEQGLSLMKQSNYSAALQKFKECLAIDNQYAELHYRTGECLYALSRYKEAKKHFIAAKDLDICPLRALSQMNDTIAELSQRHKVPLVDLVSAFEKRSAHHIPGNELFLDHVHPTVEGNQLIAEEITKIMQQEGYIPESPQWRRETVAAEYRKYLASLDEDYYAAGNLNLAKVLGWAGKEKEKIELLKRNASQLTGNAEFHYMLGNSYARSGDVDQAVLEYKQAIAIHPGFAQAYTNLGFMYENKGWLDQAIHVYEKAVRLNPEDFVAYTNLGRIFYARNWLDEAVQNYRRAIQIKPDYVDARIGLGVAYHAQDLPALTLAELKKALALDINSAEAHFNLGLAYYSNGLTEQAIDHYQTAIELDPEYADAHCSLGVAYFSQGWVDKAIAELKEAIRINPELGKAHNNLAVAYWQMGQYDLAWKHVTTAQKLGYPVQPEFVRALRKASE